MFHEGDVDGSGHLDGSEATRFLRRLGLNPSASDVATWMREADHNDDDKITFEDFVVMYVKDLVHETEAPDIDSAFQVFDVDGSGYIEADELVSVLTSLGEPLSVEQAHALIAQADVDNDGRLSVSELAQVMHTW